MVRKVRNVYIFAHMCIALMHVILISLFLMIENNLWYATARQFIFFLLDKNANENFFYSVVFKHFYYNFGCVTLIFLLIFQFF